MKAILLAILVAVLVSACSSGRKPGGYFKDDGPQENVTVNVDSISDATPRWERVDPSRSRPYIVLGKKYYPMTEARNYRQIGVASWYGKKFHGRQTALGERYDMYTMTAAHKTLPLPSYVQVRNLKNDRTVVVRVNDRGPFLHNRLIDLSYAAAHKLGMLGAGTTEVEVISVTPGQKSPPVTRGIVEATSINAEALASSTTRPMPSDSAAIEGGGNLFVQVGAFSTPEKAERLRTRLEQADFSPVLVLPFKQNEKQLYRVRIGPLGSVNNSEAVNRRLAIIGFTQTQLIRE